MSVALYREEGRCLNPASVQAVKPARPSQSPPHALAAVPLTVARLGRSATVAKPPSERNRQTAAALSEAAAGTAEISCAARGPRRIGPVPVSAGSGSPPVMVSAPAI
jgi:hypothetical protein